MNISKVTNGLDANSRSRNEPTTNTTSRTPESSEKGTTSFTDQVKISASSKNIQQIEAEIKNMPEVDDNTVERIRSAIEKGEYKIDYQGLAGKMLNFEGNLKY